jgi:biopolymer transport protein ExbB/TolQ
MWNCIKCFNESRDSAEYCAYCGSPRAASLENARAIAIASANPNPHNARTSTLHLEGNSRFPVQIPVMLRLSEVAVRVIAALIGVITGLICSVTIYLLSNPSSMTGRLFNLKEPSGAVPAFTLILFCWGLAICLMRHLRTGAAKRLSSPALLVSSIELARLVGLDRLATDLDVATAEYSPLLRRLRALTKHWSIRPSLQDADILLQQQLYSDEESVRGGYSLVRTFIWALPVIGLLGTVAGVAVAVGGFANFLGGDIEDVAVIKRSLVNVTAGLSYAFLTTLYGLAGALVLMLIATALQNREENLYTSIQEKITNLFLPFLQSVAPETKGTEVSATSGLEEQLLAISASVLDYVRQQGALTLQSLRDERSVLRDEVIQWGKLLREEANIGAQNMGQALDRVGMKMSNTQFEFLQKFESIKAGMDQQAASVLECITKTAQAATVCQQQTCDAIAEQQGAVQANTQLLTELSKVSQESIHLISDISNTLRALQDLELGKRATDIGKAIESQSNQLGASVSALQENSTITGNMLAAQASLHDSVNKLHDTGFDQTLREFRDSLTALKPVLENLREPFILQAVPIKTNGTIS